MPLPGETLHGREDQGQFRRFDKAVLIPDPAARLELDRHGGEGIYLPAGGNLAEIPLYPRSGLRGIKVAGNHQGGVIGTVPFPVKVMHIGQGGAAQIRHFADHRPVIGMIGGIKELADDVVGLPVRAVVVILPFFILDHTLLVLKGLLRDCAQQPAHAI